MKLADILNEELGFNVLLNDKLARVDADTWQHNLSLLLIQNAYDDYDDDDDAGDELSPMIIDMSLDIFSRFDTMYTTANSSGIDLCMAEPDFVSKTIIMKWLNDVHSAIASFNHINYIPVQMITMNMDNQGRLFCSWRDELRPGVKEFMQQLENAIDAGAFPKYTIVASDHDRDHMPGRFVEYDPMPGRSLLIIAKENPGNEKMFKTSFLNDVIEPFRKKLIASDTTL